MPDHHMENYYSLNDLVYIHNTYLLFILLILIIGFDWIELKF